VAETLTPEQRAKIAEMIRERREMFERHRRG
jgi:Spy/CpxP family protein refolding chaperone